MSFTSSRGDVIIFVNYTFLYLHQKIWILILKMTDWGSVGVAAWEIYILMVRGRPESTISGVLLYAKNDSDKISDRLDTLKGRF